MTIKKRKCVKGSECGRSCINVNKVCHIKPSKYVQDKINDISATIRQWLNKKAASEGLERPKVVQVDTFEALQETKNKRYAAIKKQFLSTTTLDRYDVKNLLGNTMVKSYEVATKDGSKFVVGYDEKHNPEDPKNRIVSTIKMSYINPVSGRVETEDLKTVSWAEGETGNFNLRNEKLNQFLINKFGLPDSINS